MHPLPTIFVIGEILFDIFPNYTRMGGAPFNFAYHLHKFGFPVCFVSRVGNDEHGRQITEALNARGFSTDYIQMDRRYPTGNVQIRLDENGVPDFDIISDVAYDHIEFDTGVHQHVLDQAGLIYFGTLAQRGRDGFNSIQQFLAHRNSEALCFYDINLRPNCYSETVIQASLEHSDVLKLNMDELQVCKQICRFEEDDRRFISYLRQTHNLGTVALTHGEHGSNLYTNGNRYDSTPQMVASLIDTVGAGDGFAAMLAAGTLLGWPPEQVLFQASKFASRICSIRGAIPDSPAFYDPEHAKMKQGA